MEGGAMLRLAEQLQAHGGAVRVSQHQLPGLRTARLCYDSYAQTILRWLLVRFADGTQAMARVVKE